MYESIGLIQSPKHSKMVRKVNFLPQGLLKRFRTWLRDSPAGYELAKANSKSPLDSLDRNSGEGALFEIYCISCHGAAGDGNGCILV
jgi:mono/diheme cytochrome c family protein